MEPNRAAGITGYRSPGPASSGQATLVYCFEGFEPGSILCAARDFSTWSSVGADHRVSHGKSFRAPAPLRFTCRGAGRQGAMPRPSKARAGIACRPDRSGKHVRNYQLLVVRSMPSAARRPCGWHCGHAPKRGRAAYSATSLGKGICDTQSRRRSAQKFPNNAAGSVQPGRRLRYLSRLARAGLEGFSKTRTHAPRAKAHRYTRP